MSLRLRPCAQLVGEGGQLADGRIQGAGQPQQRRVARVPYPALDAADLGEVGAGAFGELLLAQAGLAAHGADGIAEGGVLGRTGLAAARRRHGAPEPFV